MNLPVKPVRFKTESMKKKTLAIILSAITAAAIATAFVIIHKPVPRPDSLVDLKPRIHLNDSLTNVHSALPELEELDKKAIYAES